MGKKYVLIAVKNILEDGNYIMNKAIHGLSDYKKYSLRKFLFGIILFIIVVILSFISINLGSTNIKLIDIINALLRGSFSSSAAVVWNIRLPRILAAIIAGVGLAVSGCVMQNNLNNPLASPSTLGISNAAAFGANIGIIVLGAGGIGSNASDAVKINNPYLVGICAFSASICAVLIIIFLARLRGFSSESIILSGVALSSLFSAGTILIQYFAQDTQVAAAIFWTFGDLGRISWNELCILLIVTLIAFVYFMFRRWEYNAIENGNESAKSLGVNVENIRLGGMIVASLVTAVSVSFVGIIGFIGLISPQIVRRILGSDYKFLIPISAIIGAAILLSADTLARIVISPIILPVGAITSFLGAPVFFYLLIRGDNKS